MIIDQNPPGDHFLGTKSTKIIIGNRKKESARKKKSQRKEKKTSHRKSQP